MKALKAKRATIKLSDSWQSPPLHILLTSEEEVVVARCLDFTISSHGNNEKEAMSFLADALKEYIMTAVENEAISTIHDPAHSRYWRIFNEIEAKETNVKLKRTLRKSISTILQKKSDNAPAQITYA